MSTVLIAVGIFVGVVMSMLALLLGARRALVPSGDVALVINDDPENALHVTSGGTLLNTLANKGIHVPSACGGKGTCGACGVVVREGGGSLLPTERGRIGVRCLSEVRP